VTVSDETDGSRLVSGTPTGGKFTITVSPAAVRLSGCA
jgi:hypothetical protein